jgi:5-methylcytosine-specific restriction endonuclease McrA
MSFSVLHGDALERLDPRRPVTCRGCGGTFARNPRMPTRQYCTWECFKASRHVMVKCDVCGTPFSRYLSETRKTVQRGHITCCSRACRNRHTSLLLGGDGSWFAGRRSPKRSRHRKWRRVRMQYMASVGGVCEGCGARAVEVHHLFPVAGGGEVLDFDNLMAVCKDCHDNMHAQLRAGAFADSIAEARR